MRTAPAVVSSAVKPTIFSKRVAQPNAKIPPVTQVAIAAIPTDRMLNTRTAAKVLGGAQEMMKKWRQRRQGPEYGRYPNGDIRYRLSVLLKFIEDHTIRPEFPVAWEVEDGALLTQGLQVRKRLA